DRRGPAPGRDVFLDAYRARDARRLSGVRAAMTGVTVIIVNFNTGELTRRCLTSVAADLSGVEWEAVVVDNASSDGSVALLRDIPHTRVIANRENVGFGRAVNAAAALSQGPTPEVQGPTPEAQSPTPNVLLWLLNPDCDVVPGAFAALVETL